MNFNVHYFNGRSSNPQNVILELHEDCVKIPELNLSYGFKDIEVRAKLKNTPQTISFADGSYCELGADDFFSLPNSKGGSFILKIESKLKYALASFVILALFTAFSLTYGSTMLSDVLAPQIPKSAVESISNQTLELLDEYYLSESKLDKKQQDFIQKRFDIVINKNSAFKLHFRYSDILGANAFALPSGDIILLDGLVELEKDDGFRGIIGVLAHESAHVVYLHGLKTLIKTSISSAIVGYLVGDFSGFAALLATSVINAKYSRDYEQEADSYAMKIMKENSVSSKYMADLFDEIINKFQDDNATLKYSILSSHPDMAERIKQFREE